MIEGAIATAESRQICVDDLPVSLRGGYGEHLVPSCQLGESMRAWGDKVSSRTNAARFGLPLLPGSGVLRDARHAVEEARRIGFPSILKASGGGGGRGMRIVRTEEEVPHAYETAMPWRSKRPAMAA